MNEFVSRVYNLVQNAPEAYCKFLSANDSGETEAHQRGILISKTASKMLFSEEEMANNAICKKQGKIKWQDDFATSCTFTWYSSKNELRLTGFGRGFDLLRPEYTGALFIMTKEDEENYQGFILNTDEEIQDFLDAYGLTPAETNRPIEVAKISPEIHERLEIDNFIKSLETDFPSSETMALAARALFLKVRMNGSITNADPDSLLLAWTELEYRLFQSLEHARYGEIISKGFDDVDSFITLANQVLNRRKSRAGKSLEHHLSAIFDENRLKYVPQAVTEGNKKPDFLFPSKEAYADLSFPVGKLCTLAAKTTCKDRWRQVLNEADRLRDENKYLCTMQQGISSAQMDEMQAEKVILVVPKPYISSYPKDKRDRIWTISRFVNYIKEIEDIT